MLGGVVQFQDRQVGAGLLVEAGLGGRGGSCGVSRSGRHRAADDDVPARSNSAPRQAALPSSSVRVDDQPQFQSHLGESGSLLVLWKVLDAELVKEHARLLAFNAEAWLAEHFNAYLADPNEYRAILRNLLHLGGHIDYTTNAITITLDRPERPRVARALQLLTEELNATPTVMPTDPRPLTYQLAQA